MIIGWFKHRKNFLIKGNPMIFSMPLKIQTKKTEKISGEKVCILMRELREIMVILV